MAALPEQKWTPEQYLAYERGSDVKHEYLDGQIYAMAGASETHNLIMFNTSGLLYIQLRKRPCKAYSSDMRVKVSRTGLYTYPDVVVVCGTSEFEDGHVDTLLNPKVIIEVLSPSTESYDRGKKALHYRTVPSLQEYLLIAQDSYRIEHYKRNVNGEWLVIDIIGLDSFVDLGSIECGLAVADIYEKVSLPAE